MHSTNPKANTLRRNFFAAGAAVAAGSLLASKEAKAGNIDVANIRAWTPANGIWDGAFQSALGCQRMDPGVADQHVLRVRRRGRRLGDEEQCEQWSDVQAVHRATPGWPSRKSDRGVAGGLLRSNASAPSM